MSSVVRESKRSLPRPQFLLACAFLAAAACSDNDTAPPPEIGVAPEPVVGSHDTLPGVVVVIEDVRGSAGSGRGAVGDFLNVDFTVARDDGEPLELSSMARGAIMVSGPTSTYQRVIASQGDVITTAVKRALGAYTYTFTVPVPTTYQAPLNDTTALREGELTGQPLQSGTYTVGIELRKDYVVDGITHRDPGNATSDFLLGDVTEVDSREVVTLANCNQCHTELRAHGDNRNKITNCLLCHTSGAEDRNTPGVANGTPGVAIDFKVMIHKIHSGSHLPSVLGVTTNPNGTRRYDATPQPYQLMGYQDALSDFSDVVFPAWPSFYTPMPRDTGYGTLSSAAQSLENTMRRAPVECGKCHGDPDGSGPLPAPRQGDIIYSRPTIVACSSCHDDWVPDQLYTSNAQTMPIQRDNAACTLCHSVSGTPLSVMDAHRHPLVDPDFAAGLHFDVSAVTDSGGNNNGKFDSGEKVRITFQAKNSAGTPIAASSLSRLEVILTGPTANPQMINYQRIAQAYFTGNGPYTFNLPALVFYEQIGTSTSLLQTFSSASAPHWNISGATTTLLRRNGTGPASSLAANAPATQNYIDLPAGQGVNFAKDDYIVIDDANAGLREYMRIQWVDHDRLWFGSQFRTTYKPTLLINHAIGAEVKKVTTASVPAASYSLDSLTGIVTETVEFGDGAILASYTTDFVVPQVYPGALNDTPVNGEDWGDWTGLPLLNGTYTLDMHGARGFNVTAFGETTAYTEGADATLVHLLFGSATEIETVQRVVGSVACNKCHDTLQFHGGSRRSFETCISCHGSAGAENTPVYENPTSGNPLGTPVEFRHMLHRLHEEAFPAMPGGVQDCAKCHGADNSAWAVPADRLHPQQTRPTRSWRAACSSCHDSTSQVAHIDANTSPSGAEACAVCHGTGDDLDVRTVHMIR